MVNYVSLCIMKVKILGLPCSSQIKLPKYQKLKQSRCQKTRKNMYLPTTLFYEPVYVRQKFRKQRKAILRNPDLQISRPPDLQFSSASNKECPSLLNVLYFVGPKVF